LDGPIFGGLETTKRGTVVADETTGKAVKPKVWAGALSYHALTSTLVGSEIPILGGSCNLFVCAIYHNFTIR